MADRSPLPIAALAYADRGWPVFPLSPRAKTPATSRGFLQATIDTDLIDAWWTHNPDYNIGLRCGIAFDVLDVDGPDGIRSIRAMLAEPYQHGGPIVSTGRGFHLYMNSTGLPSAKPANKLDWQADGKYVVAPPSIHPSGAVYEWMADHGPDIALPDPPAWLLARLAKQPAPSPRSAQSVILYSGIRNSRPDILAVAANHGLRAKRSGQVWMVRCPFHPDKTPSLALYPDANNFYCFGCDAWGDSHDLAARKFNPPRR